MENNLNLEFSADTAREMHDKVEALRGALDILDAAGSGDDVQRVINARAISLVNTVFDFLTSLRIAGKYP